MKIFKLLTIIVLALFWTQFATAQEKVIDYTNPKQYTIADISISGVRFLSKDALLLLSGLRIGQQITIPGTDISDAIKRLWDQGLFSDVKISITKIQNDSVYLDIYLQEQPRLYKYYFSGINKSQQMDLKEKLNLKTGKKVTDNLLRNSEIIIKKYLAEKGYPFAQVKFRIVDDTTFQNYVNLYIDIDKKNKVKIERITVRGNEAFSDRKVRRFLKNTKQKNFFRFWKRSKYQADKFEEDKQHLIEKYKNAGFRDAKILEDSVIQINDKRLVIYLKVYEGKKYYFRNITWVGNTKYPTSVLNAVLDIKKGDPYNQKRLEERLMIDENSVSSLYMDKGYLFFQATPKEVKIEGDSIDIEITIFEGPQAKINKVIITGNTRTNEHVIRRELKTLPGELFSKRDLIRSVRELANLGNFDPEQLAPTPIPDPMNGTVDIQYNVVERPSDLFEMTGGWGAYSFVMNFAIKLNNFSIRNLFKPKNWDPLPIGDGQKFSIYTYIGGYTNSYGINFTEPWLGGKKPNSFSTGVQIQNINNGITIKQAKESALTRKYITIFQTYVALGRRLSWPDDYFILSHELTYNLYFVNGLRSYIDVSDGKYNLLSFSTTLARNSIDNPLYSRSGSNVSVSFTATPPYSLFVDKNWKSLPDSIKFHWVELYKITVKGAWFNKIIGNLVLHTKFEYALTGYYNRDIGYSPFETYKVGGSGMQYYNTIGVEYVGLRGYKDYSISSSLNKPAHLYSKYTLELRYPVLLKEMATLYVLTFLEAGNAWYHINEFDPFKFYRSAGAGLRLFVPMLGLVGFDAGYGFDEVPGFPDANKWQYHFTFGQRF